MRVSDNQFNHLMSSALQSNNASLNTVFEKISTGSKINHLSDDPLASMKLQGIDTSINQKTSYANNIDNVISKMQKYESYLNIIEESSQSINELLLQGVDGSLSLESREGIIIELESYKEELIDTLNKQDQGSYLFSGTKVDSPAMTVDQSANPPTYTMTGNNEQRSTKIAENSYITNNITAGDLLSGTDIFTQIDKAIAELGNDPADVSVIRTSLDENAKFHLKTLSVITELGSQVSKLERASAITQDSLMLSNVMRSELTDLDFAEASTQLNQNMLAMEATQKTYVKISQNSLFSLI